jgi:hypothetical protein
LGIGNALAFDAEGLTALNTVGLLADVTKSTVIHGFDFTAALEHALKQSHTLGKHSNIIHLTPHSITQYLWAHKDYQPWGRKLAVQCPQCGILNPWISIYLPAEQAYSFECRNEGCGKIKGRMVKERHSFMVPRPDNSAMFQLGKDCGWLKSAVEKAKYTI